MLAVDAHSAYPLVTPSPRVRIAAHVPFLLAENIDLSFSSFLTDDEYQVVTSSGSPSQKLAVVARCARRVASHKRVSCELSMVHRLLSLVPIPGRDPAASVDVYDLDDALFVGSISAENAAFGFLKRERERCDAYLRRARLVLAGNAYLAGYASRSAVRVEVLPSCVDPSTQPLRPHHDVEVLTVGWLGSASTSVYLDAVIGVFESINRDALRMRLVTIGARPLPGAPWLEQHAWTLDTENAMLARFDVGIMPMPDDPWTRGKCGYKLLRYFSAGVPAVGSPVGVNRALLTGGSGIAAETHGQWKAGLEEYARDWKLRKQAGASARRFVEEQYSYQRWAPELAAMLRSL
jgi:glycosyltransferase involved in cell wall biosynthesis